MSVHSPAREATRRLDAAGVSAADLKAWAKVELALPHPTTPDPYRYNPRTRNAWMTGFNHGLRDYVSDNDLYEVEDYLEAYLDGWDDGHRVRSYLDQGRIYESDT